jgi:hypothetical protein
MDMKPIYILRITTIVLMLILVWSEVKKGHKWQRWAAVTVGVVGFIWLSAYQVNAPWIRHHDWNGALFSHFARNHVEQGLFATRGMDLWNGGGGPPVKPLYYLNHPPLITWWLTGSFAIFGISEAVARLTGTLVVTASVLFVWARTLRKAPPQTTAVFWMLLIHLPGFMLYSRLPGHEWPTLASIFFGAGLCLGEPSKKRSWLYALLGLILVWSSWVGWVFAAGFFLWLLLIKQKHEATLLAGGAGLGVILFFFYLVRGNGGDFSKLIIQFMNRSSSDSVDGGGQIVPGTWGPALLNAVNSMIGWVCFGIGIIALTTLLVKRVASAGFPLMLLICPLIAVSILRQWAYVHEYWAVYLCLPVLLSVLLLLQQPVTSNWKRWGLLGGCTLSFAFTSDSVDRKIQERSRSLTPAKHERKIALALKERIPPNEVFTAIGLPSPIFLYYANRDFLLWPVPDSETPAAFVQIHGRIPSGEMREMVFSKFQSSPHSKRVLLSIQPD